MDDRPLSNISRYFVYTALKGIAFGLITAMWLIYLQHRRGLTLTQATFVDVSFWIAGTLGEIPTGIVADTFGRKTSLTAGAALMAISILAWAFAPIVPLIIIAYMGLGIGTTFLSGADDALFYESVQQNGRGSEYTRLTGRVNATLLGATALGNAASGWLATFHLILPFLVSGVCLLAMLVVIRTFAEPRNQEESGSEPRRTYAEILRQSLSMMRNRPALRYPMFYMTLVPVASIIMETFFLQPQAIALGVPLTGVGLAVMALQFTNMAGSSWSDSIRARFGAAPVLYAAPALIVLSLTLLALLQTLSALLFIALIGFATSVVQPLALSRIQEAAPDSMRATLLSMQSLMFMFLILLGEPALGFIADRAGFPPAYLGLSGALALLVVLLFRTSRAHFPQPAASA